MEVTVIPAESHEQVVRCRDAASGLHAIIAVHDTTLGPALGGMRMLPYSSEEEALFDVLRLSKGMTYKSAVADSGFGGGKSVIIGDPTRDKGPDLFRAMGRFIDSLQGTYITAEDMNIGIPDLEVVRQETRWVTGLSRESGSSGNPSPFTAMGCVHGLRAVFEEMDGSEDMGGRRVLIQGVGAVGGRLAELLAERGARVTVCDLNDDRADAVAARIGGRAVPNDAHLDVECDVYAPCARGATINDDTVPLLKCRAVAGCANNQLLEPRHADALRERGILYAPDYVINAGGLINVAAELLPGGYDEAKATARLSSIYDNLRHVFAIARAEGISTRDAAARLAHQRLAEARSARKDR